MSSDPRPSDQRVAYGETHYGHPYSIYRVDGTYVVAQDNVWLTGVFDTLETAMAALFADDRLLYETQQRKNAEAGGSGGVISMDDLRVTP